jgi:hypothetical protein
VLGLDVRMLCWARAKMCVGVRCEMLGWMRARVCVGF